MKKYLLFFFVFFICVFVVAFGIFFDKESFFVKNFNKNNNAQALFELTEYYKKEENYFKFVEYGEKLLFDKTYSFNEIDLKNTEFESNNSRKYDSYMQEYLLSCVYVYSGDEYIEKLVKSYKNFNNYGYAITGVEDSIQEYYSVHSDVEVCIKAYNRLVDSASHIVTKYLLISSKYDFVLNNCDNEKLKKETEEQLKKYEERKLKHMETAKKNGIDVVEYNNSVKP